MELSRGSLHHIKATKQNDLRPTLQVYNISSVVPNAGPDGRSGTVRYKFHLTDGSETISAMAATQTIPLFKDGAVKENTIVMVTSYQINAIGPTNLILVVLGLEIVGQGASQVPVGGAPASGAPMPAPAPSNVPQRTTYAPAQQNAYNPPAQATNAPMGGAPPAYGQVPQSYGQPAAPHQAPPTAMPPAGPYGAAPPAYNAYGAAPPAQTAYGAAPSYGTTPAYNAAPAYGGAPAYGARGGAVVKEDYSAGPIVPISAINPYSSKWTIKARVTSKSDMKHWANARGEGTLFSIDLLDGQGGEIRGTFFKEACTKFFPQIAEGQVYTFSGGVLKVVQNRQYTTIKNAYEITFNQNSEIRPAANDIGIKSQSFSFVKLSAIGTAEVGTTIDVLAVVRQASEPTEIVSQKMGGKTLKKRDLNLVDETGFEIRFTWWGDKAMQEFDWQSQPIVAIKGAKIGDYGGRSLGSLSSTTVLFEPATVGPEYQALQHWKGQFQQGGVVAGTSYSTGGPGGAGGNESFDKRKTIAAIKDEGLGMQEKPDYIVLKGSVVYIKHDNDPWYTACPTENCNKKVTENMQGQWFCEKCNRNFDNCNRRYILSISMSDHTGSGWFSLFNDTAEKLLGCTAQQLYEYRADASMQQEYENVFSRALFQTVIAKCRVKQESVMEEMRVKTSIIRVDDIDFASECKNMLEAINKYQ